MTTFELVGNQQRTTLTKNCLYEVEVLAADGKTTWLSGTTRDAAEAYGRLVGVFQDATWPSWSGGSPYFPNMKQGNVYYARLKENSTVFIDFKITF